MRPLTLQELNIPATVNTLQKRLGYFIHREQNLLAEYNKSPKEVIPDSFLNEHVALLRELSMAKHECTLSDTGNGPPDWVTNKAQNWKDGAVVWPPGITSAAPEVRMHFLSQLQNKLTASEKTNAEDIHVKLYAAVSEIAADTSWRDM